MWQATEDVLESIATGAGILGTGGGGNPYIGQLRARQAIKQWGPVTVLAADELPEDARVVYLGGIGAPTVGIEKTRDGTPVLLEFMTAKEINFSIFK